MTDQGSCTQLSWGIINRWLCLTCQVSQTLMYSNHTVKQSQGNNAFFMFRLKSKHWSVAVAFLFSVIIYIMMCPCSETFQTHFKGCFFHILYSYTYTLFKLCLLYVPLYVVIDVYCCSKVKAALGRMLKLLSALLLRTLLSATEALQSITKDDWFKTINTERSSWCATPFTAGLCCWWEQTVSASSSDFWINSVLLATFNMLTNGSRCRETIYQNGQIKLRVPM